MTVVQALTGHVSPETAYLVEDYPYGFRERCRIRYWIEFDEAKGYRACSQTEHPRTKRWNAPKRDTYRLLAMALYLNEEGHVKVWSVSMYAEHEHCLKFVQTFPSADPSRILKFARAHARRAEAGARGGIVWTIGGVVQPPKEADLARYLADLDGWNAVLVALGDAPVERKAA